MPSFYLRCFAIFFSLRVVSVLLHYLGPSPWGGALVLSPHRFIPEALVIEAGIWGVVACLGALFERTLQSFPLMSSRMSLVRGIFLFLSASLAVFSLVDFEVTRWLGQHMSASYIRNFAGARDGKLLTRILSGDVLFSSLALLQMLLAVTASGFLWTRFGRAAGPRLSRRQGLALLLVTLVSSLSPLWLRPSEKRWRRVCPAGVGITQEALVALMGGNRPKNSERARQDLIDFVYTGSLDQGTRPEDPKFPVLRTSNLGRLSVEAFRRRPLKEKPDVIVIVFETMRGANTGFLGDPNSPLSAMPELRQMIEKEARYFPRMHSAGYPSVGGAMGLHMGMWPHHTLIAFSSFLHVRTLAFPEMLRNAGYRTFALLGADPSFSNFTPWFRRWYDDTEYDPKNHHDGPLVDRFLQIYDERASSPDPLLMTIWTATTHPPYDVPKDSGVVPAESNEERYLQAMHYADEHIARLLRHLQKSPRYDRTLVFLLGDHSQPTPWAWTHSDEVGELNAGHTWTSLAIFGGKEVALRAGRDERAISHIDLAPTIVSQLDLRHENHFFGRDVLKDAGERPVHSFSYGAISEELGSVRSVYRIEGDSVISYRFDRDEPRSYGALAGGMRAPAPPLPDIERTRDMARFWAELLEDDRLLPPD
jgi:lipoteichoic acid synthase